MKRSYTDFVERLIAVGLLDKIERRALAKHITLLNLYKGPDRAPSIVAARKAVYAWLMSEGKGLNEVARLFDRAPSGVLKLMRGRNA